MGVLAVQALLVAVDHGLPVEVALVLQAAAVRAGGEIHTIQLLFETWEEVFEAGRLGGDGGEQEAGGGGVRFEFFAVLGGDHGDLLLIV